MSKEGLDISVDHRSGVPLYEQICQQIRDMIENRQLSPGEPLPTTHQLRESLQVNAKTAQQAMATLAKEGYVTRQARRGTVVKGIPRRGVVGIYAHFDLLSQDGNHEYYRLITANLRQQLDEHARVHRFYLGSLKPEANSAIEDLLRHARGGSLCGMLLVNTPPHGSELIDIGRASHMPVISLSGNDAFDYSVRIDLPGYVLAASRYLKRQGRKHVGVIYNHSSASFRSGEVVAQLLKEAGLSPNPAWIIGREETVEGGFDAASAMPVTQLDGLIIEDDVMALGVEQKLKDSGIDIPGDLMVTTLWNHGSRLHLKLPFHRFETNPARCASASLELLQQLIKGQRVIEPHLRIVPELNPLPSHAGR